MVKLKYLFVCAEGEVRSPTAYDIYKKRIDCFYCGLSYLQENIKFIGYFDVLIVFEEFMKTEIQKLLKEFEEEDWIVSKYSSYIQEKYEYRRPLIECLDIEDIYGKRGLPDLILKTINQINERFPGGLRV